MKVDIKANKEEFLELLRSTKRDGIEDVITDLEELGFFTAPASAGHHLNVAFYTMFVRAIFTNVL